MLYEVITGYAITSIARLGQIEVAVRDLYAAKNVITSYSIHYTKLYEFKVSLPLLRADVFDAQVWAIERFSYNFV